MDSNIGGQSSEAARKRTAAMLARKKVLAAYGHAAGNSDASKNPATGEESKRVSASQTAANPGTTPAGPKIASRGTLPRTSDNSHLKDSPINPRISPESWKKYHSAWQNYYQKYYSDYYSRAAQVYIEKEKLKKAREKADEEEILKSLTRSSAKLDHQQGMTLGRTKKVNSGEPTSSAEEISIRDALRQKIRKKATENVKQSRRRRRFIPILAGLAVVLFILFLQYNRLIFAPIMAYVSPGNAPASEIEAIDPVISQTVSPEPRLIIPKLNIDVPIRFGVSLDEVMAAMNNGVAHYRIAGASAYPGEVGNFVITGHSAGDVYSSNPYKYIFSGLERLEDKDLIYVNYNSVRYTYQVTKKEVVEPTNVGALVVQTNKPLLTLVTCTPLGTSRYRLLVTAEQISPTVEGTTETTETTEASTPSQTVDNELLPANEPSFFEGIWGWLTGN